ncbi:CDP-alcohol phosphatidyltransferase family protein [Aeromicrobium sp. 50.2.37]|uniref:CDP-alcohol phosphatidyltransferase family protein n=1 Tax=Aeromicrobium sp. 50.2.37 TaxID=2969305 RepID=UPI00214F7FDF|nr:CDP-alcohol phosphatidyltransferase family protein [Aeromicrobium sp. 50.2.37]MCR4514087.1 CDP-alcohol phosphatidyltransferase family protein [Aeromicrobium sp. 50.2.37]
MTALDVRTSWDRLAAAQKDGTGVPLYMRAVNRRLGRGIAAVAHRFGATPDQMTAVSALLVVAALAVLVLPAPSVLTGVAVTLLLQGAFAFDAADGQLARLRGSGSVAGEWLDHTVDAARTLALHLAVAVALLRHTDLDVAWALLPLGFAFVASVRFFAQILAEQLAPRRSDRAASAGRYSSIVQLPADVGVQNLVFLLWPLPGAFLVGYGLLAAANLLLLVMTLRRRLRALRALG